MDKCGIDMSVVLPVATKPTQVLSINNFAAQINTEKRLISFGSVHPLMTEAETDRELERIVSLGLKGIKLHPEGQEMYIDSPAAIHIINKAYDLGLFVIMHTGSDLGFFPPVHCSPERLKSALDYFDGSNIIAAHFGGYRMWEDVYKYLAGTNIYLDTALTMSEIDKDLFFEILKKHSSDKILYGSDSPWEVQNLAYEYMKKWNVPDLDKICFENAKRILKL
jgi:predicted TIM-barrel fold metal-dependent hydrolase